jgi:hypothetical protein
MIIQITVSAGLPLLRELQLLKSGVLEVAAAVCVAADLAYQVMPEPTVEKQ